MIARRTRFACTLATLAWLLPPPAAAQPDWQTIGQARGVEAFSARTDAGVVRIGFRNTSGEVRRIAVQETVIWCDAEKPGEGAAIATEIGAFRLEPGASRWSPEWSRLCSAPRYFVEFRGITIAPAGDAAD